MRAAPATREAMEGRDMTDQTSDTDDAVIEHERTSEPELTWAQAGWTVYDRSGMQIGEITERDDYSFVVLLAGSGGRTRVPTRLVAEGSAEDGKVTLTVGRDELDRIEEPDASDTT